MTLPATRTDSLRRRTRENNSALHADPAHVAGSPFLLPHADILLRGSAMNRRVNEVRPLLAYSVEKLFLVSLRGRFGNARTITGVAIVDPERSSFSVNLRGSSMRVFQQNRPSPDAQRLHRTFR
jgi:hypothetical protein